MLVVYLVLITPMRFFADCDKNNDDDDDDKDKDNDDDENYDQDDDDDNDVDIPDCVHDECEEEILGYQRQHEGGGGLKMSLSLAS